MNGLLWLGVGSTGLLVISLLFDGADDLLDGFDGFGFDADWLSLPVITAFLGAFGFVAGGLVDGLGGAALAVGLVAGVALAVAIARLGRFARDMPTDPTDAEADLLASFGRIVTAPHGGRFGEVLLTRPAGPVKVACLAGDPASELPAGTEVVVVDVTSSTLVTVEPFDGGLPPGA